MPGEISEGIGGEGLVDRNRLAQVLSTFVAAHAEAFDMLTQGTQARILGIVAGEAPDPPPDEQVQQ